MSADRDTLSRAGRGFVWLTLAKLHFMLAGWAIYFVLPRLMSEVDWGRFLSVLFLVSILNNVMVSSAVQGVSRFTAASPAAPWPALRGGLVIFAVLGTAAVTVLAGGAPWIAAAHADASLTNLYRLAAPIALAYALYAACVGSLNGRQRFGAQAGFDATYATVRLGAMILGALLLGRTLAAAGAHGGYSTAAVLICLTAIGIVAVPLWQRTQRSARDGAQRAGAQMPLGAMIVFIAPLALHQLGINLLMRTDPLLVKALGGHVVEGTTAASAADAASVLAGRYGTAQVFALVPYQALIALSMVVFPLVADAASADRREALRETAAGALRFALIFGAGLAAMLAARPADVIDLVYEPPYRAGGVALQWQAWGVIGLSLITLCCAMLNAAGRTGRVLGLTFGIWVAQTATLVVVLRQVQGAEQALRFTALASMVVLLGGALTSLLVVRHTFGVRLPGWTAVRATLAAAAATGAGALVPGRSSLLTIAVCLGVGLLYLGLLMGLRELTRQDLAAIGRVLRRGS